MDALEADGLIGINRVRTSLQNTYWPKIPRCIATMNPSMVWFADALSDKPAPRGRPRLVAETSEKPPRESGVIFEKSPRQSGKMSPAEADSISLMDSAPDNTPPPSGYASTTNQIDCSSQIRPAAAASVEDVRWLSNGRIEASSSFRAELAKDFPHVDLDSGLAIASGEALPDDTGTALKRRIRRRFGYLNNEEMQRIKRAEAARGTRAAGPPAAGQPTRTERLKAMANKAGEKLTYKERLQQEADERSERLLKRITAKLAKQCEERAANPEMSMVEFRRQREEDAEKRRKQSL